MTFSIFGREKKDTFLVFDIGNASVGGALVKRKIENGHPSLQILTSEREEIPFGEHVLFDRLLKNMLSAVGTVAERLTKKAGRHIPLVRVVLASPWYISETKIISIKKAKKFVFTETMQNEFIAKEISDYKQLLVKRNKVGYDEALSVVESEIINVCLNGYDTVAPLGKEAYDIKLALYLSVSHEKILKTITDKLLSFSPNANITFHSFPLAYFSAVRDLYPKNHDFLLLDVSGEITDVSLVRRGVLLETASFPLGRNFLLRRVAIGLKRTLPEAFSLLSLSQRNELHQNEKEKFTKIFFKVKDEWLGAFQKVLADLSGELYVPGEIFLAADDDVTGLFAEWISGEQFSQYSLTHEKFRVLPFFRAYSSIVDGQSTAAHDQFIDIAALFTEKLIDPVK